MQDENPTRDGLAITETPIPAGDLARPLTEVENQVRDLIQQLSFCRRELKDKEREHTNATQRLLLELLEVSDAFERVLQSAREQGDQLDPAAKRWINSFRTVDRLLGRAMRNQGVVEIQTLDQMFDPTWHTAVEVIEDPDAPEGSIHRVQRKGYVWKNLVLRKTEAVVVKNEENA